MWDIVETWFSNHEWLAIWLEGIALVAIFIWDRIDNNAQHKEMVDQLKEIRTQASAALIAANAAKRSADLTAEIQRPHVGIANVITSGGTQYFNTTLTVRNFGALAAHNVVVKFDYFVENVSSLTHTEPSTWQLFPGDTSHVTNQFDSGVDDWGPIRAGQRRVVLPTNLDSQGLVF